MLVRPLSRTARLSSIAEGRITGLIAAAILSVAAIMLCRPAKLSADNSAPPPGVTEYASTSNAEKAEALVQTAINMTDSDKALKLLWQATDIDPTLQDPYIYLGLYYNSRSDFDQVVQVYQKLVKYDPKESSAYLNIGEAYMSFTPPRTDDALVYYQKALSLDPTSSFAALRMGEIYAQQGNREMAVRYLKMASGDVKNPDVAAEANHYLSQMGAS
jgi:tetratricopeptide (TPR) repeat protein